MSLLGLERSQKRYPDVVGRIGSPKRPDRDVDRALTAASTPVDPRSNGSQQYQRLHQEWQEQSLAFYDISGVCATAADFYGKAFGNLRFFPARRDRKGTVTEITDEDNVLEIWARLKDRGGGKRALQRDYGRLQFLIGDGFLTITGEGSNEEVWEYLSPTELRLKGDKFVRVAAPGMREVVGAVSPGTPLANTVPEGSIRAWRLYNPHPRHSQLAHSSMQPVLDDFEELVLLTAAVRARVKSRLASAGILLIPEEVTFPDEEAGGEEDPNRDIFLERLMAHMIDPIQNEGTASAVVPFVVRVAMQYIEGFKLLRTHDPNETYREIGLRAETIKRIGISLDMPPEMLTGMGDMNHWVGWLIDEQWAKAHVFPGADQFGNDLGTVFLRPECEQASVRDWEEITVGYDPSQLVVHPDRSQNAKDVFDRGELGGATLRKSTGFEETDAPTDDERLRFEAIKLRDADLLRDEPENQTVQEIDQTGDSVDETAPDPSIAPETQPTMSALSHKLVGAAEFAVSRSRSLAGSRLRPKIRGCAECVAQANDVPNHQLAAVLGQSTVGDVGETAMSLVKGAGVEFMETVQRWDVSTPVASALASVVETFAITTLFDHEPEPLPAEILQMFAAVKEAA